MNSFNVVRVARPEVTVDAMTWRPEQGRFGLLGTERFRATGGDWARLEADPDR